MYTQPSSLFSCCLLGNSETALENTAGVDAVQYFTVSYNICIPPEMSIKKTAISQAVTLQFHTWG